MVLPETSLAKRVVAISRSRAKLELKDIPLALDIVYAREGDKFELQTSRLSPIQLRLLTALAQRGGKNVQSGEFLKLAGIGSAASARRALTRLEDLRYIYCYRGEWRFNSTFFKSWIKKWE